MFSSTRIATSGNQLQVGGSSCCTSWGCELIVASGRPPRFARQAQSICFFWLDTWDKLGFHPENCDVWLEKMGTNIAGTSWFLAGKNEHLEYQQQQQCKQPKIEYIEYILTQPRLNDLGIQGILASPTRPTYEFHGQVAAFRFHKPASDPLWCLGLSSRGLGSFGFVTGPLNSLHHHFPYFPYIRVENFMNIPVPGIKIPECSGSGPFGPG